MRLAAVFGAGLLAAGTPAPAQNLIDGSDPSRILEVARGYGSAELTTDGEGDPLIRGRMSGHVYNVFFYGCDNGRACSSIQLYHYRTISPLPTPAALNGWNATSLFAYVYVDADDDLVLSYEINLFGGVSALNLDDSFDWYKIRLDQLDDAFGN